MAGLMMSRLEKTWGPMCNQNQLLKYLMMSRHSAIRGFSPIDWTVGRETRHFPRFFWSPRCLIFHSGLLFHRNGSRFSPKSMDFQSFSYLFLQGSMPGCVSFTVARKVASSNQTWPKYAKIMENPKIGF